MAEEYRMILQMVADKKITPEEGDQLLQRLKITSRENSLVEPDALNLIRLGFEAIVEQVLDISKGPSLSQRLASVRDRLAKATQRNERPGHGETEPTHIKTERIKMALTELIQCVEALNQSLDDALARR